VRDCNLCQLLTLTHRHIVFNCACIIKRGAEHDLDAFEQVLTVNLTGNMQVGIAMRGRLKASRGCIINTAFMLNFFGGG
jgi:NAD(P)-dependent dehydrogenase (short-subunit alcohol dehydrogenase family)